MASLYAKDKNPISIFCAYSHRDIKHLERLFCFLKRLERDKDITIWHDGKITPSQPWDNSIKNNLRRANVVLFLLSQDAIDSDYLWKEEMMIAEERHKNKQCKILPIYLNHADLENTIFLELQGVPNPSKPIRDYRNQDKAWLAVVQAVRRIVANLFPYEEAIFEEILERPRIIIPSGR